MFTGIVEDVGQVRVVVPGEGGHRFRIEAGLAREGLRTGDSIAVDGVCLTVVGLEERTFDVEAIATTLARTTLASFQPGRSVNLERALAFGDRLGGHLVQGHVDGVGEVLRIEPRAEHTLFEISLPAAVADVTVLHGSLALNGVSLTVNDLSQPDTAQVAIIPHTWEATTFRTLRVGDRVNLEGDVLGRFVVHYLMRREGAAVSPS